MKTVYTTLEDAPIGILTEIGYFCWVCKELVAEKDIGCLKCKTAKSKVPLDVDQVPAAGVHLSYQFEWQVEPKSITVPPYETTASRIRYVKENRDIKCFGHFINVLNNTCAIQIWNGKKVYSNIIEDKNRKRAYVTPKGWKQHTKEEKVTDEDLFE
jgi:hypothetical protein